MIEILTEHYIIIMLFFIVAILYSSVGFGGGSSYLAILALSGIAFTQMRAIALLCNIIVVLGNVFLYNKNNSIDWQKTFPIVLFSVPFAYLGGYLKISQQFFFILLGFTLFVASLTMWFSNKIKTSKDPLEQINNPKNAVTGSFIGFISGMVGIGGGIFLAPFLHLTQWDTPKKIAATASVFILVNSLSGLLGQFSQNVFELNWQLTLLLLTVVFVGGQIGSKLSHKLLTPIQLKKATALLIAFVSIRILLKYLA